MPPPHAVHRAAALAVLFALGPRDPIVAVQIPDTGFSGVRQVTRSENYDPSFSPDGRSLVYISVVAGREHLFVRSLDGRRIRQLTTDTAVHADPAWSPTPI